MRMPTHIVIDLRDGWTWSRDKEDVPFTEQAAKAFAAQMNSDQNENRTCVVAAVTPLLSHELLMTIAREANRSLADIRDAITEHEKDLAAGKPMVNLDEVVDAGPLHETLDRVCIDCGSPMGQPHKDTCVVNHRHAADGTT